MPPLDSPWHDGERALHRRLGIADRMEAAGRHSIRSFMPDQHRVFFAQLPFILVGSSDRAGQVWASLLPGPLGFVTSPEPRRLEIDAVPAAGDPLTEALVPGAPLGVLGLELPTRRRNRVNGHVVAADGSGFTLAVEQSFGNCPKYIVRRDYLTMEPERPVTVEPISTLDPDARRLIGAATTFFVASSAGLGALPDVSHRGGQPGFVAMAADGTLTVPDYSGNLFFNTLGNLLVNPQAGLLFPDFATGDLLQLTGATELVWDGPDVIATPGAQRLWRFHPIAGRWLRAALPLRFAPGEISPVSPSLSGLHS
ncbi:MAG TPA: pyridoxamine 5'-phosphate oxidase family protein [Stellaceae bacterium]|nr:pyridoxamine 5'-phosphate oxidase family protein [Stellaceae bacterium]